MRDQFQFDHCDEEGLREVVRRDLAGCVWGVVALLIPVAVLAVGWWLR